MINFITNNIKYKIICILFSIIVFVLFVPNLNKVLANYHTSENIPTSYKNIGTIEDVIALPDGNLWYADSGNIRIVKISPTGEVLRTVGRSGSNEGEFSSSVTSITRDANGNIYVLDLCKVYKLDFNGGYINSWGTCGNGGGSEFANPRAIHYSEYLNYLLVADTINNRIAKFDLDGNFISQFGTLGSANGEFNEPMSITTDVNGKIYVADTNNHRVQVFEENGTFIRKFGGNAPLDSSDNYYFEFPKDVEVLSNGDIVVSSQNSHKIKKFDSSGTYLSEWSSDYPQYLTKESDDTIWVAGYNQKSIVHYTSTGTLIETITNKGTTSNLFDTPFALDFDNLGNLYVLDGTGRVQKFDSNGDYISTIIAGGVVGSAAYHLAISPINQHIAVSSEYNVSIYDTDGTFINSVGTHGVWGAPDFDGTADGEFNNARGLAFDSNGYLYVVDYSNSRVQKFDLSLIDNPAGGYLTKWSVTSNPENIYIDVDDNIYVSPSEHNGTSLNIEKYNTSGIFQSVYLDKYGTDPDQYYKIKGMFMDNTGKFYISDAYYNRVQIYNSDSTLYETIGSPGGDFTQFDGASYSKKNPITGDLVTVDSNNHRVQLLITGVKIKNLIQSNDVLNTSNNLSLVKKSIDPNSPSSNNIEAELNFGQYVISDFTVDLTQDRDWNSVRGIILPDRSKSLIVNLNPIDAPGVSSTHSLFITKQQGQSYVRVCPDATQIADLTLSCTNGYVLNIGDPDLSIVTIGSQEYWKVSGLTGTGGLSPVINSFEINPLTVNVDVDESITLPVSATNDVGLTDLTYTGTVTFSTNAGSATLPGNYTYQGSDSGQHTFENLIFHTVGTFTLTVTDISDPLRTQSIIFYVSPTGTNNNSAYSDLSGSGVSCNDTKPVSAPDLFQINTINNSSTLFFTPISNTNRYVISYSTSSNAEQHGTEVFLSSTGVQDFTINLLKPNTTYYFKVRGQIGCMPGKWSTIMKAKTNSSSSLKTNYFYKYIKLFNNLKISQ